MPEDFLKLMSVRGALSLMLESLAAWEPGVEVIRSVEASGRVLAGDVSAPGDLPGFERSTMDGYAVRAADTFGAAEGLPAYLDLVGEVPMGEAASVKVGSGQAVRISTGGVLPEGADAVVMVEDTELSGGTVEVVRGVAPGENTVRADEDVAQGSLLLRKGEVLGPAQIGALVGLGILSVEVFRIPTVGIISTGDELVAPEEKPTPGRVRDINTASLCAAVARTGCSARPYGITQDDLERLLEAARLALRECDMLIISGGSSAGVRDMTIDVVSQLGEPGVLAHGIYLKPGKPTILGICDGKPVMGLPGNPASALVVFREVTAPLLSRLRGESRGAWSSAARTVEAVMKRSVSSAAGRLELVPVSLSLENETLVASPVMGKSSLIGTLARAHGQVRIGEGTEGLEQGERVIVELFD